MCACTCGPYHSIWNNSQVKHFAETKATENVLVCECVRREKRTEWQSIMSWHTKKKMKLYWLKTEKPHKLSSTEGFEFGNGFLAKRRCYLQKGDIAVRCTYIVAPSFSFVQLCNIFLPFYYSELCEVFSQPLSLSLSSIPPFFLPVSTTCWLLYLLFLLMFVMCS